MRVLLDTHILYWWYYDTERLSRSAVDLIRGAEAVFVNAALTGRDGELENAPWLVDAELEAA